MSPLPPSRPARLTLQQAADLCAAHGERLTPLRQAVLGLILAAQEPLGAYELLRRLGRSRNRPVTPPTVYRSLEFLLAQGLVARIETLNAYIALPDPAHPRPRAYLLCASCGGLVEIEAPEVDLALQDKARALGFEVARQVLELQGTCGHCRALEEAQEEAHPQKDSDDVHH